MRSVPSSGRPWFPAVAPAQRRECAVIGVTLVAVGLSYGALSQASGFPLWQTVMLAALAIGGAAELTFVGVVAAGGARSWRCWAACW
ncbi:hypothetical protein A5N15_08980 [Rothia kristinae]|uniref:Uncharacterized protein n=1 Tax=Rothia kristinae TaxID=37923 RepID=A0A657ITV2_9MICC|nr:hypothetical protein A5N15_08980 [Rothia kristinae]